MGALLVAALQWVPTQIRSLDGRLSRIEDIETRLGIWRQATVGASFVRLGSAVIEDLKEIEAELTSFSRYAIAY